MRYETLPSISFIRIGRPARGLFFSSALTFGLVCCLLFVPPPFNAQGEPEIRYRTEANYLAHFASFVDWPASAFADAHAPLQLCMFGNVDFGNSIMPLTNGLKPHGRRIEVRSLKKADQYKSCHILFIGREDSANYNAILSPVQDLPVLTVGETVDFPDAGGIVNFVFGETLQIDVNAGAAHRAHLKIHSALQSMARRVTNMPTTIGANQPKH
jgi:hypothetical protein